MQAVFIISIFSMVIGLMAAMISGGTSNADQLTQDRIRETQVFFESIAKVVQNEITRDYLHGNPDARTTPADLIRNAPQLKQLASGRLEDPALDAWGNEITGVIVTQYQSLRATGDTLNTILVPVTGYVFISNGPNGTLETTYSPITTLNGIYGVVRGGDDIVFSFDNRRAQEQLLESIQTNIKRIGTAALKELQSRVTPYRQQKLVEYQDKIARGQDVNIATIDITNDANAPTFLELSNTQTGLDNRLDLGVDEEFTTLERKIGGGGNFQLVASKPATLASPLVLQLQNNPSRPTPWGNPSSSFRYQISISAINL